MNSYCVVMWLGPGNEKGLFVKAKSTLAVEQMVRDRRWKGKLVQIIPMVLPGNHYFEHITSSHLHIVKESA